MTLLRSVRPSVFIAAVLLAASPGCGGTAEGDDGEETDDGCEVDGVHYAIGEDVPSSDCNGCFCTEDGTVGCTTIACGDGDISAGGGPRCYVDGTGYWAGELVSNDGCNSCYCDSDGGVSCTRAYCGDGDISGDGDVGGDPCVQNGVTYASGETVPSQDCNSCSCQDGSVLCTLIACPEPVDVCELPFEGGDCDAYFPVYFHNPATGSCEEAVYGGCGGNANRFATLDQCVAACTPPPP